MNECRSTFLAPRIENTPNSAESRELNIRFWVAPFKGCSPKGCRLNELGY